MRLKFGLLDEGDLVKFNKNLLSDLKKEIAKNNNPNLLISSEHLSSRLCTVEEIMPLKNILTNLGYQSKILIYFRRQDELIPSEFSTSIKAGNVVSLNPHKHNFWFNYHTLCERWSEVFGKQNIICRPFQKTDFHNNNLIDDFLHSFGVSMKESKEFKKIANNSLDAKLLKFLQEFNKRVPFNDGNKVNTNRGNIAQLLQQLQATKGSYNKVEFSSADKATVLARYRQENSLLAQDYQVKLHLDINNTKSKESLPPTKDEMYDIFAYLWSRKQSEINLLRKANAKENQ